MAVIDLPFALAFGISLKEGAVYNVMRFAPTYCTPREIDGDVYYFVSRNMLCEKLSKIVTDKPDTMYRYYKKLEKVGLIKLEKVGTQDYVHIVAKYSQMWNSDSLPTSSEINPTLGNKSELLGNKSENTPQNSDLNPTYIRVFKKEDTHTSARADSGQGSEPTQHHGQSVTDPVEVPLAERASSAPAPSAPLDPHYPYNTGVFNDFLEGGDAAFENILSRLRKYHEDHPGTGQRIAQAAKCTMTAQQYGEELREWVSHNQGNEDFYRRPTRFLQKGRGSLWSWLMKDWRQDKYNPGRRGNTKPVGKPVQRANAPIRRDLTNPTTRPVNVLS